MKSMKILVKQVSNGDRKAYATLIHEFYTPLLFYSIKFTKNREASEDIIQDFFCRLWEDRKRLVNDKSFYAYIYSSVRNRSLNYLRDSRSISIEGFEKQSDEDFLREMMEEEKNIELLKTLKIYLENNMNYSVTAEKMYVHINTIRKRIDKVNDLVKIDWEDHVDRLKMEILLQFLGL